jgi:hypothetical protein
MKTYSAASADLESCIARMLAEHHPDLEGVTVSALFVFDDESSDAVLKHQGYPAAAVVSITPVRQRALGVSDAVIVVDRTEWQSLTPAQRDALIDHELTHLQWVVAEATDDQPEHPKSDCLGRPKLAMRRHDHQLGWFDDVARRHGEHSPEMRQARSLVESTNQLYFDFNAPTPSRSQQKRAAAQAAH